MEQTRAIAQQWLQSVVEGLTIGEELLLPALSKADVKEKFRLFSSELRILNKIDPTKSSELQITTRFKDHRFWLVIKKVSYSPFIGFKKGRGGEVERILIEDSSGRRRRLLLMKEDGFTLKEMEEIEGKLSQEDLLLLK